MLVLAIQDDDPIYVFYKGVHIMTIHKHERNLLEKIKVAFELEDDVKIIRKKVLEKIYETNISDERDNVS